VCVCAARLPTMQRMREPSADGSSGATLSERDQSNMATPQTVNDWLHLFEDVPMRPQIDAEVGVNATRGVPPVQAGKRNARKKKKAAGRLGSDSASWCVRTGT